MLATQIDILSKTYQAYITNMNIALKYNSLYTNAFQQKIFTKKIAKTKTITINLMLLIFYHMEKYMISGSKIQIIS